MHIIPIISFVIFLLINGFLHGNSMLSMLNMFQSSFEATFDDQFGNTPPDNIDEDIEEGDFYQDEDGNLVIVIPEGQSMGGISDED